MNKENQYINIDRISAETHAQFDTFAASIMADTMRELTAPNQELELHADGQCAQILHQWVQAGLINIQPNVPCSTMDVAMARVLTVLKKRGLSMAALRWVRDGLNLPMYEDMSVLGMAVLLCRDFAPDNTPYLVIDGENRITLCRAVDVGLILNDPEIATYSHLVLNMRRVLHECNFILKIRLSRMAEFIDLPAQIADRLFSGATKRFSVDMEHRRLKTVSNGGTDPEYGERTIKYANGRVVSNTVTAVEVLNG